MSPRPEFAFRSVATVRAGRRAGFALDRLKVGVHALGYVAATTKEAADDFDPGYARAEELAPRERLESGMDPHSPGTRVP